MAERTGSVVVGIAIGAVVGLAVGIALTPLIERLKASDEDDRASDTPVSGGERPALAGTGVFEGALEPRRLFAPPRPGSWSLSRAMPLALFARPTEDAAGVDATLLLAQIDVGRDDAWLEQLLAEHGLETSDPVLLEALLAPYADDIEQLMALSRFDGQFGDTVDDYWSALPQYSDLRSGGRLLSLAALLALESGDADRAAEVIAAGLRNAAQAQDQEVMIGSLVSASMAQQHLFQAERALLDPNLSAASRQELLGALDPWRGDDPLQLDRTLRTELRAGLSTLDQLRSGSRPDNLFGDGSLRVSEMDDAAYRAARDGYRAYGEKLSEAWAARDVEALQRLEARVASGEFGPVTQLMAPSLDRLAGMEASFLRQRDALLLRLERD